MNTIAFISSAHQTPHSITHSAGKSKVTFAANSLLSTTDPDARALESQLKLLLAPDNFPSQVKPFEQFFSQLDAKTYPYLKLLAGEVLHHLLKYYDLELDLEKSRKIDQAMMEAYAGKTTQNKLGLKPSIDVEDYFKLHNLAMLVKYAGSQDASQVSLELSRFNAG